MPDPITNDELTAWVALHSVQGIGAASLARLLARFGSPQAVLRASPDELDRVPKVPHLVLSGVARAARDLDLHRETIVQLAASDVQALRRTDPAYPSRLQALASPPPLLYVRGRLLKDNRRTFGIVGTTRPSDHGRQVARTVARGLAERGWVIVSGHARGIDEAAHLGAFDAGRPTVLVLPTGILQFQPRPGYPPPDTLWRHAAAVSEAHPQASWKTPAALARNRLTAALSDCLLVVETRQTGGTMSTFRHAMALGRRTFVVRFREPALSAAGNGLAEAAGAEPIHSLADLERLLAAPARRTAQQELRW